MPYIWVEPEVAAEVDGVKIYHTYKGDDLKTYWFTTDPTQDDLEGWYEGTNYQFDIRDIDLPPEIEVLDTKQQLEYIILHRLVEWPED